METPTEVPANVAAFQILLHSKKEGKDQASIQQVPHT